MGKATNVETTAPAGGKAVVMGGGTGRFSFTTGRFTNKLRSKKVALWAGAGAVAGAATVGSLLLARDNKYTPPKTAPNITSVQYAARQTKELQQKAPAANATTEDKINYYSALVETEFNANSYDAGVADYKTLTALMGGQLGTDGSIYTIGAQLYAAKGDKPSARTELAKARAVYNKQTDVTTRTQNLNDADIVQQELGL